MRFGRWHRHDLHWYDFVIVGLAGAMVFPDKVVQWVNEHTGRELGLRHVVLVEVVATGLMAIVMMVAMAGHAALPWWYPLVFVGAFGLLRFVIRIVTSMFGLED